jgi:hypothetical protein
MASVLSLFSKPLQQVDASDIQQLVDERCAESSEVEFKRTLPDSKGAVAQWITGKDAIGDYARDQVLGELVAFANATGGFVILGIGETQDKPPRAKEIVPLPRVGELARRFEDQIRTCVDPQLSRFGVKPVITDGSDAGVLILYTGASRRAPHRLTTNLHSYVRRGSSSVRMSMHEIQDMTLNVARGTAGVEGIFNDRMNKFHEWGTPFAKWSAFRVTAVPLESMPDPGRMYGRGEFLLPIKPYTAVIQGKLKTTLHFDNASGARPILRGIARVEDLTTFGNRVEQYQSGMIDVWSRHAPKANQGEPVRPWLYQTWLLGAVANALALLDNHRRTVGAPNAEYALETEVMLFPVTGVRDHSLLCVGLADDGFVNMDRHEIAALPIVLPRLSVGTASEFDLIVNMIDCDLYDSLGRRYHLPFTVHW